MSICEGAKLGTYVKIEHEDCTLKEFNLEI
jgi:hypothetical protein